MKKRVDHKVLEVICDVRTSLAVNDYRGRLVGAHVEIRKIEYTESSPESKSYCWVEAIPGVYFEARVQKLKSDVAFGSSQMWKTLTTEEDARKYVENRLRGIRVDTERDNAKRGGAQ